MPSQDDYTAIAIALGALVLLGKWSLPKVPLDKLNILPESKEFGEGLFDIDPGFYAPDQSGSPYPRPQCRHRVYVAPGPYPRRRSSVHQTQLHPLG